MGQMVVNCSKTGRHGGKLGHVRGYTKYRRYVQVLFLGEYRIRRFLPRNLCSPEEYIRRDFESPPPLPTNDGTMSIGDGHTGRLRNATGNSSTPGDTNATVSRHCRQRPASPGEIQFVANIGTGDQQYEPVTDLTEEDSQTDSQTDSLDTDDPDRVVAVGNLLRDMTYTELIHVHQDVGYYLGKMRAN